MESRELKALRSMAWERAKGELFSMYHTFYGETLPKGESRFDRFSKEVEVFVKRVEDHGLEE